MENKITDPSTVNGLDSDVNPQVDHAYHKAQHSSQDRNQRNAMPPPAHVFDQTRRLAFTYSEHKFKHWLPLMLAHRIDIVEGIVDNIAHRTIPSILSEQGLRTIAKYRPGHLVKKVVVRTAVAGIIGIAIAHFIRRK